jgi:hypothetical protein
MYKALGDRIDTISVADLLHENEVQAVVDNIQQDGVDQRSCTHCGQRGHGKYPNIDLRKIDCPAYGKKCAKCQQKGHYAGGCKSRRGVKKDEALQDSNHFTINRMKMTEKSGKISRYQVSHTQRIT